jgi:hypothetical protein
MTRLIGRTLAASACMAALMTIGACDGGASAVASRTQTTDLTGGSGVALTSAPAALAPAPALNPLDPRSQPVRLVDGKPVWAATSRLSADEAARANFERNGADFGVESVPAWITKVHDFVESPPRGAERVTRTNGDILIYDAGNNVFAVVTKDGAPRTMFKPREGAAYWAQQKGIEASRTARAATASAG